MDTQLETVPFQPFIDRFMADMAKEGNGIPGYKREYLMGSTRVSLEAFARFLEGLDMALIELPDEAE